MCAQATLLLRSPALVRLCSTVDDHSEQQHCSLEYDERRKGKGFEGDVCKDRDRRWIATGTGTEENVVVRQAQSSSPKMPISSPSKAASISWNTFSPTEKSACMP